MKKSYKIIESCYSLTDIGRVRPTNEDSAGCFSAENFTLLAVCDGMGGHRNGEVASSLCLRTLKNEFGDIHEELTPFKAKRLLGHCLADANQAIYEMSQNNYACFGMGTTAVVAIVLKDETIIANIGDSRLYRLGKGRAVLKQVTHDQSYVQRLLDRGKIKKSEAANHPNKNIITNAVGIKPKLKVDYTTIPNDYSCLLLCSDGLYNMISDQVMTRILKKDDSLQVKCLSLINTANDMGGADNISVALYERRSA